MVLYVRPLPPEVSGYDDDPGARERYFSRSGAIVYKTGVVEEPVPGPVAPTIAMLRTGS